MTTTVAKIMWNDAKGTDIDFTEALPAFLIIVLMPLTYSISNGIIFGTISFVLLKLFTGRYKEISIVMYILAAFFIFKLVSPF